MNKNNQKTAMEEVIESLLSNLRTLTRNISWSTEHPLIKGYIKHMNNPKYFFHGWEYTHNILKEMDKIPPDLISDGSLRLRAALLFHRIICSPGGDGGITESLKFTSPFYRSSNLGPIGILIRSSALSLPFETFGDDRDIMRDLILSGLGAEAHVFEQNRIKISQEQEGFYTVHEWNFKVRALCFHLIKQSEYGGIFCTNWFRNLYEEKALKNIRRIVCPQGL